MKINSRSNVKTNFNTQPRILKTSTPYKAKHSSNSLFKDNKQNDINFQDINNFKPRPDLQNSSEFFIQDQNYK